MIRVILVFTFACLLGLIIQSTLFHSLSPSAIAPNFIIALVVYLGLRMGNVAGLIGAFFLGLVGDFASAQFIGPNAAGCVLAFNLVVIATQKIYAEHPLAIAALAFLATLIKSVIYLMMIKLYAGVNITSGHLVTTAGFEALLTAVVAPFVIKALEWGTHYRSSASREAGSAVSWSPKYK